MEVILLSIFSIIIVGMTVFFMLKAFLIANKRKQLSSRKMIVFSTLTIVTCNAFILALPFAYERLFAYMT